MSFGQPAIPEDVVLAGRGDLAALRRMRDHCLNAALSEPGSRHYPPHEAIAQMELLAEMAAGSGQAEDQVTLIAAYQVRIASLEHNLEASRACAAEATCATAFEHWSRAIAVCDDRLRFYRDTKDALVAAALADTQAAAVLVKSLGDYADSGGERAVGLLQSIMDSFTPERAGAIQAEVRRIEEEEAR